MMLVRTWAVMKTTTVNLDLGLSSKQHVMTVLEGHKKADCPEKEEQVKSEQEQDKKKKFS